MSSFYINEPNVAYNDTSADLTFGTGQYLKNGADMTLFGLDEPMFENNMFLNQNAANQNMATVSPQQLSMPMMGSVPSSATIPELSPNDSELWYSPTLSDNLDTPLFGADSNDQTPYLADNMAYPAMSDYPLFPSQETSAFEAPAVQQPASAVPEARKRSLGTVSVSASPVMGARPTGIRKKSKQLMPIVADENDPIAIKRARNTEAARRSRAKKNEHVDALQAEIDQLKAQLAAVQQENAQLRAQNSTNATQQQESFDDDLARLLNSA